MLAYEQQPGLTHWLQAGRQPGLPGKLGRRLGIETPCERTTNGGRAQGCEICHSHHSVRKEIAVQSAIELPDIYPK